MSAIVILRFDSISARNNSMINMGVFTPYVNIFVGTFLRAGFFEFIKRLLIYQIDRSSSIDLERKIHTVDFYFRSRLFVFHFVADSKRVIIRIVG